MVQGLSDHNLQEIFRQGIIPTFFCDLTDNLSNPTAFVIGGQPGAGKSRVLSYLLQNGFFKENPVVIDGDSFRYFHPKYEQFHARYGKADVYMTQEFSNAIVQKSIEYSIEKRHNILVEGTFRNPKVPLDTIAKLNKNGYSTGIVIKTCPASVSWASTIERYKTGIVTGTQRYTPADSHFYVVDHLAENVVHVFEELSDHRFIVLNREGKIYDTIHNKDPKMLYTVIDDELSGESSGILYGKWREEMDNYYEYSRNIRMSVNLHENQILFRRKKLILDQELAT